QHALLDPVLSQIEGKFAYRGPAREYFLRAIHEQVEFTRGHNRLHYLGRYFAWQGYLGRRGRADRERREHAPLRELCREQRRARIDRIARIAELAPDHPVLAAIIEIPRERFVPTDQISESVADVAIALDDSGAATVSAMHAYARSFSLLQVGPGDRVLDLGAGTGYGTALLGSLVGEPGRVWGIELDPALVEAGRRNLGELAELEGRGLQLELECADACDPSSWGCDAREFDKVTVGFALEQLPSAWLDAFAPGTVVVAPLREPGSGALRLVRAVHREHGFELEWLDPVAYVPARRPAQVRAVVEQPAITRLPVLR